LFQQRIAMITSATTIDFDAWFNKEQFRDTRVSKRSCMDTITVKRRNSIGTAADVNQLWRFMASLDATLSHFDK